MLYTMEDMFVLGWADGGWVGGRGVAVMEAAYVGAGGEDAEEV